MSRIVVGADIAKGAWAAIRLVDGCFESGCVCRTLEEVAQGFGRDAALIALDVPLSYPAEGTKGRLCEVEGRRKLGARRSSMFDTYPASVLDAGTFEDATAASVKTVKCGISQQSFSLGRHIKAAHALAMVDVRIRETHPELVFANLARGLGQGELAYKKSWTGFRQRLALLEAAGIHLPVAFPAMDEAGFDDVVDAAAAALAADRVLCGAASRVPAAESEPAIWY